MVLTFLPSFHPATRDVASGLFEPTSQPSLFDTIELTFIDCYARQPATLPATRDFQLFVIDCTIKTSLCDTSCLARTAPVAAARWSQMATDGEATGSKSRMGALTAQFGCCCYFRFILLW